MIEIKNGRTCRWVATRSHGERLFAPCCCLKNFHWFTPVKIMQDIHPPGPPCNHGAVFLWNYRSSPWRLLAFDRVGKFRIAEGQTFCFGPGPLGSPMLPCRLLLNAADTPLLGDGVLPVKPFILNREDKGQETAKFNLHSITKRAFAVNYWTFFGCFKNRL